MEKTLEIYLQEQLDQVIAELGKLKCQCEPPSEGCGAEKSAIDEAIEKVKELKRR